MMSDYIGFGDALSLLLDRHLNLSCTFRCEIWQRSHASSRVCSISAVLS